MPKIRANGLDIYVERRGPEDGEPLLMLNGYTYSHKVWPPGFVRALGEQGFSVILTDNRDIGRSSLLEHLDPPDLRRITANRLLGRRSRSAPYHLDDMAADAVGVLDALGIDRAHVVGFSMGGMIGQRMAIDHRARVRSLTLMSTDTGSPLDGLPTPEMTALLFASPPRSRHEYIANMIRVTRIMGGSGFVHDPDYWAEIGASAYDWGVSTRGIARQAGAVQGSGDRRGELSGVDVPALIIHGDEDPLLRPGGARALHRLLDGSTLYMVPRMGHQIPAPLHRPFAQAIADLAGSR